MIKQAMSAAGLEILAVGGLLVFVGVFLGVCLWVTTRSRKQVDKWSSLPLADGTTPVEARHPSSHSSQSSQRDEPGQASDPKRSAASEGDSSSASHTHRDGGCGNCAECSCVSNELISVASLTANGT